MICLICRQAEIVAGTTSVEFERGEFRLLVKHVPARICPHCQEAYLDEDVVGKLLENAGEISKSGWFASASEYSLMSSSDAKKLCG